MKKHIKKENKDSKQPLNAIGEANLIDGTYFIIDEEEPTFEEEVLRLLTELVNKK